MMMVVKMEESDECIDLLFKKKRLFNKTSYKKIKVKVKVKVCAGLLVFV